MCLGVVGTEVGTIRFIDIYYTIPFHTNQPIGQALFVFNIYPAWEKYLSPLTRQERHQRDILLSSNVEYAYSNSKKSVPSSFS